MVDWGGLPLDSLPPVYMSQVPRSCVLDMEWWSPLWLGNQDLHLPSTCNYEDTYSWLSSVSAAIFIIIFIIMFLFNVLMILISCFLLFVITSSVSQKQGILPEFLNDPCAAIHVILCFVFLRNIHDVRIYTQTHMLWIIHSELIQCPTFTISISHEKMTNLVDCLQVNTPVTLTSLRNRTCCLQILSLIPKCRQVHNFSKLDINEILYNWPLVLYIRIVTLIHVIIWSSFNLLTVSSSTECIWHLSFVYYWYMCGFFVAWG